MKTQTEELKTVVTLDGSKYVEGAKKVAKGAKEMAEGSGKADKELQRLKKTAPETASAMDKLSKNRAVKIDTRQAMKKLGEYGRYEAKIVHGKGLTMKYTAQVDDSSIKRAKQEAESLNRELDKTARKRKAAPGGATDSATEPATESGGGSLFLPASKGSMAKMGIAGAALAGVHLAAKGAYAGFNIARQRETNEATMSYYLDGDKKQTEDMMAWATKSALPTQFTEGEVQAATTRALQVTGGDTERAKKFVKLAQDMAALNAGQHKTLDDAMEALADADMGELARMAEFGFKGGVEEFEAAGGDLFAMKSKNKGKTLEEEYAGGVEATSETTDAKIGTAMGILETTLGDFSSVLLDRAKPAFADIITVVSDVAPKLADGAMRFIDIVGGVMEALKPLSPVFELLGTFVGGVLMLVLESLGSLMEDFVIPAIENAVDYMKPALKSLADAAEKLSGWFHRARDAVSNFMDALSHPVTTVIEHVVEKTTGAAKDHKATGTNYFKGGLTQMNENGRGEIVDLPSGARIYPYSTTQRMIKKLAGATFKGGNNNTFHVNIDARGSNLTPEQVHRLKREIVDDIVDAFDNSVPA